MGKKIAFSRHLPNPSDKRDARRVSSRRSSTSDVADDAGGEPKNGERISASSSRNGVQVYFYLFRETGASRHCWACREACKAFCLPFLFFLPIFFRAVQKSARHPSFFWGSTGAGSSGQTNIFEASPENHINH